MTNCRYFAKVNKDVSPFMVEEVYMAEENDPMCQVLLDKGFIESETPVKESND